MNRRIIHRMKTVTLREARRRALLTQDQLAAKSGIDQTTISRLESGTGSPSLKTLAKLARALKMEPSSLHFGMGR